jgi:mevalonate kinase
MVAYVKSQKNLEKFLYANEIQTKRVAVAIKDGDESLLIDAIQKGEKTLEQIGVVSQKAKNIIRKIERGGGAAKILGGGGRSGGVGYLLCYSHHPPEGSLPISLGDEGVRLEVKS